MTGIERLRRVAEAQDMRNVWTAMLSHELSDIADQIERERACDADTIENIRLVVGVVIDDMERHCLGHEGMEDSPVARWARELRGALKSDTSEVGDTQIPSWHDPAEDADVTSDAPKVTRDPAEDVSMSVYDLLPADEREAIAWVRKHGGIDHVRAEWISRVPHDLYERSRQRLLDHIAECETALGRRRRRIEELGHRVSDLVTEKAELRRRAMPEGMEWPRYESGEPVRIGDVVSDVEVRSVVFRDGGILLSDCTSVPGWGTWRSYKEPIKRPAVLASDGEPIKVGEHVWDDHGEELVVLGLSGGLVRCRFNGETCIDSVDNDTWKPSQLTHERPESWERLEEDAEKDPCGYFGFDGEELCGKCPAAVKNCEQTMALDIVRRCRALAERERSE